VTDESVIRCFIGVLLSYENFIILCSPVQPLAKLLVENPITDFVDSLYHKFSCLSRCFSVGD
jgi:hypothetical protein